MPKNPHQDALDDALIEAVKANRVDEVRQLLASGANPNKWCVGVFETPLHYAAVLGFDGIAEALLMAGADVDPPLSRFKPLLVATFAGKDGVARLIRDWASKRRLERAQQEIGRLGWSLGSRTVQEDEAELSFAGTEKFDPRELLEIMKAGGPFRSDVPFTSFKGWIKQVNVENLPPITEEAIEAGLPWFLDLSIPPEKFLSAISQTQASARKPYHFSGQRHRRFAGDGALPRTRYYTLCEDETGYDDGTLVCEMLTYSHIARTGKIYLIDMADSTAPDQLDALDLEKPNGKSILLVFRQGRDFGLSPFLLKINFATEPIVAFPIPVDVISRNIDKVVDLRIPDTADWFAQAMSQAVLEVYSKNESKTIYLKCWPFRPPLENFGQILPEMLTQELGGGVLSLAVGALLRKAGANALVYPSARNDSVLRVKDGTLRRANGWNLVDYRGAPPPKQMVIVNVDRAWPKGVKLGPGFDFKDRPRPDLFSSVTIDYEESGTRRGSFEVDGIVKVHTMLRDLELKSFRKEEMPQPWWNVW